MSRVRLHFLGSFEAVVDDCPLQGFASDKERAPLDLLDTSHQSVRLDSGRPDVWCDVRVLEQEAGSEIPNLTVAWQAALNELDLAALRQMIRGLSQLWYSHALFKEAAAQFAEADAALRAALAYAESAEQVQAVPGRVLVHRCYSAEQLGNLAEGLTCAQEVVQLGNALKDGNLASVDLDQAQSILRLASRRLLAAAATIDDLAMHHAFLHNVASHRQVPALMTAFDALLPSQGLELGCDSPAPLV